MAVVLRGTVVSFDATHRVLDDGAVYVGDDGRLAAVAPASDPAPAGFANASGSTRGAVIYPGLIDLHNHIAYNTLPLWEAPGVPYQHHKSWTREDDVPDYGSSVTLAVAGARAGGGGGADQVRRGQGAGRRARPRSRARRT